MKLATAALVAAAVLRIATCGLRIEFGLFDVALQNPQSIRNPQTAIRHAERARVLAMASTYLRREPLTITSSRAAHSAGGAHDFFSEGDYRWPDPKRPDVQYHDEWPMRHPALLFAGLSFGAPEYINRWKTLRADSDVEEVVRNFFIRQAVPWLD